jgi:molybdopterin molybdotransferase
MTGAVVPAGADAVVPVEHTGGFQGETVTLERPVRRGDCIRLAGSEVEVGDVLLRPGTVIRAAQVGALAVLGIDPVPVCRRPRVAILSTGNEVVDIHRVPEPHQVRDSNAQALAAQVLENGGEPQLLGIARDDVSDLRERMSRGLREADLLLTIGGVSKGTHDLVHGTLAELGVEEVFHGIALKPGKPTYFGERLQGERKVFVFGLPGNPASSFTVFDLLVRPLLRRITGAPALRGGSRARLEGAPFKRNRRLQAVPAAMVIREDGRCHARLVPPRPSGDPFGLLPGDGYALIPADTEPGDLELAPVISYSGGHEIS